MSETSNHSVGPVLAKERIQSIDTLRGVALLGILLLNIIGFALPLASYFNPAVDGSTEGINLATYMTIEVIAEGSMRALFSMLFGAGLLLFINKPNADPAWVKSLFYRRTGFLILFGLVNAYIFVWFGDILFVYGIAGLLLYFFRNLSAQRLAAYAIAILVLLSLLHTGAQYSARSIRTEVVAVEALPSGTALTPAQEETLQQWDEFLSNQFSSPEQIAEDIAMRKSDYLSIVIGTAKINILIQTLGLIAGGLWDAMAMMLLGMAFMKWGLFDASRTNRFYAGLMSVGFAVGMTVNYLEVRVFVDSGFEIYWAASNRPSYEFGRLCVAIGYIGLVMLLCKSGLLLWLQSALAAVGRIALTNYLAQSVICNTIFMGFGFGLVAELERYQIYYVVFGVWVFQLIFSSVWLKYYRFGPAEWLWRSLTYKEKQMLRR